MSKQAEMNRQRRWIRTVRGDHQARARVARDMAEMSRMMDAGSRLIWPVLAMMGEEASRHNAALTGGEAVPSNGVVGGVR